MCVFVCVCVSVWAGWGLGPLGVTSFSSLSKIKTLTGNFPDASCNLQDQIDLVLSTFKLNIFFIFFNRYVGEENLTSVHGAFL